MLSCIHMYHVCLWGGYVLLLGFGFGAIWYIHMAINSDKKEREGRGRREIVSIIFILMIV